MFDEVQSLNFALQKYFIIYCNFDIQIAIYMEVRIYIYVKNKYRTKSKVFFSKLTLTTLLKVFSMFSSQCAAVDFFAYTTVSSTLVTTGKCRQCTFDDRICKTRFSHSECLVLSPILLSQHMFHLKNINKLSM